MESNISYMDKVNTSIFQKMSNHKLANYFGFSNYIIHC